MSAEKLGRRYERLLLFSAPLSIAALITCLVAVAASTSEDKSSAQCLRKTADAVAGNPNIDSAWSKVSSDAQSAANRGYYPAIIRIWAPVSGCKEETFLEPYLKMEAPQEIASSIRSVADKLDRSPMVLGGVELPELATLQISGTRLQLPVFVFAKLLHIALAPLLVLWLGSLYATRFREAALIGKAKSHPDIFPHVLNMYPYGVVPTPRKKFSGIQFGLFCLLSFYAVLRVLMLALMIGLPVGGFAFALLYLYDFVDDFLWYFAGFLILIPALGNIFLEVAGAHASRLYAPPIDPRFTSKGP